MSDPDYTSAEKGMREVADSWLKEEAVSQLLGYEQGTFGDARPVILKPSDDPHRLVWNASCVHNLTRFLISELRKLPPAKEEEPAPKPIGIILKPCDAKTLVELFKENIVKPEQVRVLGLACQGVYNLPVVNSTERKEGSEPSGLSAKCLRCSTHTPPIAEVVVGEPAPDLVDDGKDIEEADTLPLADRWSFWEEQMSRCLRCYACREACPLCYCQECVFDREKPYRWIERSVDTSENLFYHLIRAMHLAGRCIDCMECERACPVGIPLHGLNRLLEARARERFDIEAGKDPDQPSVFSTYDVGDPGERIW